MAAKAPHLRLNVKKELSSTWCQFHKKNFFFFFTDCDENKLERLLLAIFMANLILSSKARPIGTP